MSMVSAYKWQHESHIGLFEYGSYRCGWPAGVWLQERD